MRDFFFNADASRADNFFCGLSDRHYQAMPRLDPASSTCPVPQTSSIQQLPAQALQSVNNNARELRGKMQCSLPGCPTTFNSADDLSHHHKGHLTDMLKGPWYLKSCLWPDCRSKKSGTVFSTRPKLKKHLRTHFKDHWCSYENCIYDKGFVSRHDLNRHVQSQHSVTPGYNCPFQGCSCSFSRKDKLDLHTRQMHPSFRCPFDHCEKVVLDAEREDHLAEFHSGKVSDTDRSQYKLLFYETPTLECTFPGCESSISKFTIDSARRHLSTCHGLSASVIFSVIRQYYLYGSRSSRLCFKGNITMWEFPWVRIVKDSSRPCITCAKKTTARAEPQTSSKISN